MSSQLLKTLARSFPTLDPEDHEDAVCSALQDWVGATERNGGERMETFLKRAAWRNARDLGRGRAARRERERRWHAEIGASPNAQGEADIATWESAAAQIAELLPDDRLRKVFQLLLLGERTTEAYATALDMHPGNEPEMRRLVKREKDRLDKFLRRDPAVRSIVEEAACQVEERGLQTDVEL